MKKLIIVLGLVLMFGVATAVGIGVSKNASIDTVYKDKIDSINDDPIERGDIKCDNLDGNIDGKEKCVQKIWKGNHSFGEVKVRATKCKTYDENNNCQQWIVLKSDKIKEELTKQQEKKLESIAKYLIKKDESSTKIDDAGEIILTAK